MIKTTMDKLIQADIWGYKEEEENEIKDTEAIMKHLEYWNSHVAPILKAPRVRELTAMRARRLVARLGAHPNMWVEILDEFPRVSQQIRGASWLTFDWFLGETNLAKWLEGSYRPKHDQYHGGNNTGKDNGCG